MGFELPKPGSNPAVSKQRSHNYLDIPQQVHCFPRTNLSYQEALNLHKWTKGEASKWTTGGWSFPFCQCPQSWLPASWNAGFLVHRDFSPLNLMFSWLSRMIVEKARQQVVACLDTLADQSTSRSTCRLSQSKMLSQANSELLFACSFRIRNSSSI